MAASPCDTCPEIALTRAEAKRLSVAMRDDSAELVDSAEHPERRYRMPANFANAARDILLARGVIEFETDSLMVIAGHPGALRYRKPLQRIVE